MKHFQGSLIFGAMSVQEDWVGQPLASMKQRRDVRRMNEA